MVAAYAAQPDASEATVKIRKYYRGKDKISLSEELKDKMEAEWLRTDIGPTSLARYLPPEKQYLKAKVRRWINGEIKRAPERELNFVLSVWEALPDKSTHKPKPTKPVPKVLKPNPHMKRAAPYLEYVIISEEDLTALRAERQRTGMGGRKLWHHAKGPPAYLDYNIVQSWLDGQSKSAPPEYVRYVLDLYKSLPSRKG